MRGSRLQHNERERVSSYASGAIFPAIVLKTLLVFLARVRAQGSRGACVYTSALMVITIINLLARPRSRDRVINNNNVRRYERAGPLVFLHLKSAVYAHALDLYVCGALSRKKGHSFAQVKGASLTIRWMDLFPF